MGTSDISFLFNDIRYAYLLVVISGSGFLLFWGLLKIRREERRRLKSVSELEYSAAVLHPPNGEEYDESEDGVRYLKSQAVESVETRFEFMRRFFVPLVLFISFILISLPFLPTLPATYLSLVTGLIAGVIGLASKPVVENAIAGMVLTFSQPIKINDTVIIDDRYGTIEKINMLHTVIKIWNWRRLVVPNNKLLQKEIENLTMGEEDEWAYISFDVEPSADINLVKQIAKESMRGPYLETSEEPSFWIMDMQKDSVLCWLAGWAKDPARAWALKSAARRNIIGEFQKHGIAFQMSRSNIHLSRFKGPQGPSPS